MAIRNPGDSPVNNFRDSTEWGWTGVVARVRFNARMKARKRILLCPELESFAGEWDGAKRLRMGGKFLRWGWQLIVTGKIICAREATADSPDRRERPLALRLLALPKDASRN